MGLVDHEGDVSRGRGDLVVRVFFGRDQLIEDEEELERVGGTDDEVVIRIFACVEVETAEARSVKKLGHDLLDVHALRVMPCIDQDLRLRAEVEAHRVCRAPVRQIRAVKARLEELVLDQQTYPRGQGRVDLLQALA